MVHIAPWKIVLILLICAAGLLYAAPNLMSAETRAWMQRNLPGWMPTQSINLGLDLQGGSYLLLEVDTATVVNDRLTSLADAIRGELRSENIRATGIGVVDQGVELTLVEAAQLAAARTAIRDLEAAGNLAIDEQEGAGLRVTYSEAAREDFIAQAVAQSIEIVRRRIDETGTREPLIQRQGADRILLQLPGIQDPQRVKDLLGQTAKMTFHMVDESVSARDAQGGRLPPGVMRVPTQDGLGFEIVRRTPALGGESLVDAQPTFQEGQPVVSFRFDTRGGRIFCRITSENVGRRFAIILDDEVISAPVIRDAICGGSGVISGSFTVETANDLAILLRAGALPAPLEVLEERTVGPSLGADSVAAGQIAALVALGGVIVFMIVTYALFGLFAATALLVNMALIFAILSALQATLTLPGIAGIVLTVGMAVDANVLIFERIREEIRNGRTPISSIDQGYQGALSTILDANITTLIAALFLYTFGSGPVKGFAVTLAVGIVTSLFSSIWLTRLMVVTWLRATRPKELNV